MRGLKDLLVGQIKFMSVNSSYESTYSSWPHRSGCLGYYHEINHLDGKLIIDHLSKLRKDMIIKKISKLKKNPDRIIV